MTHAQLFSHPFPDLAHTPGEESLSSPLSLTGPPIARDQGVPARECLDSAQLVSQTFTDRTDSHEGKSLASAMTVLECAVSKDREGLYREALSLYVKALNYLIPLASGE